jgi:hypothetical protein
MQPLESFIDNWNNAEREFINNDLETKRTELWSNCRYFLDALVKNSYCLDGSLSSCIPEAYRKTHDYPKGVTQTIAQLKTLAEECYKIHQEFIRLGKSLGLG